MKKTVYILAVAMFLSSCAASKGIDTQTQQTATSIVTTEQSTAVMESTASQTTVGISENSPSETTEASDTMLTDGEKYVELLKENEQYQLLTETMLYVQVTDLNDDYSPEVIITCTHLGFEEKYYSYIFSKNEGMVRTYYLNKDIPYSYYGSTPVAYTDENGGTVFLCTSLSGGVGTGEFGEKEISFNGEKITEKILSVPIGKQRTVPSSHYAGNLQLFEKMFEPYSVDLSEKMIAEKIDEFYENVHLPDECRELYREFLIALTETEGFEQNHYCFDIYDIDNDMIPEIFVSANDYHVVGAKIYTIADNAVTELTAESDTAFGSYGRVQISPDGHIISSYFQMGAEEISVYSKKGDTLEKLIYFEGGNVFGNEFYRINDNDVSKEEYLTQIDNYKAYEGFSAGREYRIDSIESVTENELLK